MSLLQQPFVFIMGPDPEPHRAIRPIRRQRTIPRPRPHRPQPPHALEVQRRVPRVRPQQRVMAVGHPLGVRGTATLG